MSLSPIELFTPLSAKPGNQGAPPPSAPPPEPGEKATSRPSANANRRGKKPPAITSSAEALEIEYLKIQLNIAQTKIVDLENKANDKHKTNVVLTERLKNLEHGLNQNIFQIFPSCF